MDDDCLDDHSRTIIHIDIDCFYAQVEMIKNPELRNIPFAVNQKSYIVTSNYVARNCGLKKMMLVQDAKKVCPNLRFINGEDLHDYRQMSYKVTNLIQRSYKCVERLALDENYIDVSDEVNKRLESAKNVEAVGNIFGDTSDLCSCGCTERIKMGTIIAQELRDQIKSELQLTTCAGIAHNKLLAKLVGSINRPDQQTANFPNNAVELMLSMESFSKIPGIGHKCVEELGSIGIMSVEDLQNCDFSKLSELFGNERAQTLYDMSFGLDQCVVKVSGKPQSIGIEDCKPLSSDVQVRSKLNELLGRVLILIDEDGRLPSVIKLTVRQVDRATRTGNRKTKQCPISPSLFHKDIANISDSNVAKFMTILNQLFSKLVDTSKPYHLTLLGISFTKFVERRCVKSNLTYFWEKNTANQSANIASSDCNGRFDEKGPVTIENAEKKQVQNKEINNREVDKKDCLNTDNRQSGSDSEKERIVKCPPHIDENVFRELPQEIQEELSSDFERSQQMLTEPSSKKLKPNSIKEYFIKK